MQVADILQRRSKAAKCAYFCCGVYPSRGESSHGIHEKEVNLWVENRAGLLFPLAGLPTPVSTHLALSPVQPQYRQTAKKRKVIILVAPRILNYNALLKLQQYSISP